VTIIEQLANVADPTGQLNAAIAIEHHTGYVGAFPRLTQAREGWVEVTLFPPSGADTDVTTEYTGPVLYEDDDMIRIEVFHEPLTLSKDRVIITRAAEIAHREAQ
jgi:hypothetical protein